MAELLFEIWRDDAEGGQTLQQVSQQSDDFRLAMMPNATLMHTFKAKSDFDAFQKNHDWNGWGVWRAESDWQEQFFYEDDAAAQKVYLMRRP